MMICMIQKLNRKRVKGRSKQTFEMLLTDPPDTALMAAIINGDMSAPVVTDRVDDVYTTPVDSSLAH